MKCAGATVAILMGLAAASVQAEEVSRFYVDGDRLIYDTDRVPEGEPDLIVDEDVTRLRGLLSENPDIRVLELNSGGGNYYAAFDMSDIVIDFELDTHVNGECASSCVTVFLGGERRTMARGSRIGFHQSSWDAEYIEEYYTSEREDQNWATPFEFAEWMYRDTQSEIYNELSYMIRRGVDAGFAVETLKDPYNGMWYPYRAVLMAAGVLTE